MAHFPIVEQHGFAKDFLSCFGTVPRIFLHCHSYSISQDHYSIYYYPTIIKLKT